MHTTGVRLNGNVCIAAGRSRVIIMVFPGTLIVMTLSAKNMGRKYLWTEGGKSHRRWRRRRK